MKTNQNEMSIGEINLKSNQLSLKELIEYAKAIINDKDFQVYLNLVKTTSEARSYTG